MVRVRVRREEGKVKVRVRVRRESFHGVNLELELSDGMTIKTCINRGNILRRLVDL